MLEIHADFGFVSGCIVLLFGIIKLLYSVVCQTSGWRAALFVIIFGAFISARHVCDALEVLDILEHKLTN